MKIIGRRHITRVLTFAAVLALLFTAAPGTLLHPPSVEAAQWTVTSLADDGSPGTLRDCIKHSTEGDTILFQHGLHGTITLDPERGPLEILCPITIEGPGANVLAVDGNYEVRVFAIGGTLAAPAPEVPGDVLDLAPGEDEEADVVISGLTIQNGFADAMSDPDSGFEPGVVTELEDIRLGGNLLVVASRVSFVDCVIQGGVAEIGGGIGVLLAYLSLDGCTVRNNVATNNSGDVFAGIGGGLLAFLAYVDAIDCTFENNVADDDELRPGGGGAMSLFLAFCGLDDCTLTGNSAGNDGAGGMGGGILAMLNLLLTLEECSVEGNSAAAGPVELGAGVGGGVAVLASLLTQFEDCLIADNVAGGSESSMGAGGGVVFLSTSTAGVPEFLEGEVRPRLAGCIPPVMVNCTVSGNSAMATGTSLGGGIWARGVTPGISFCTITNNTAGHGGGISTNPGGTQEPEPEPSWVTCIVALTNSIVAGNTCTVEGNEILGYVERARGNIIGDSNGWNYDYGPPYDCEDLVGVDPRLGPLANNGGPTRTHALLPDSPALDGACDCLAGVMSAAASEAEGEPGTSVDVIDRDQRGEPRPVDSDGDGEVGCDIGAFEAQPDVVLDDGSGADVVGQGTTVGDCTIVLVTITNEGDAPLLIESIELSGDNAGDFSLLSDLSGIILDPGESTQVELLFCPSLPGWKRVTVRVFSTDPDEPVVQVDVVAMATRERKEPRVEPARTVTSYLNVDPTQVLPGQQVTVSANVCNSGGERGSHTASLAVNGSAEQSRDVTVSPGACKRVVFAVCRSVPGTYTVFVDGMQGQFTVLSPRLVQASVPSQQEVGLGTAGIIAIIVVAIVLIVALVFVFKRE